MGFLLSIFYIFYSFSYIKFFCCTKVFAILYYHIFLPSLYNFFHCFNVYTVHFPIFFLLDLENSLALFKLSVIPQQEFFFFSVHKPWLLIFTQARCKELKCSLKAQPKKSALIKVNSAKIIVALSIWLREWFMLLIL